MEESLLSSQEEQQEVESGVAVGDVDDIKTSASFPPASENLRECIKRDGLVSKFLEMTLLVWPETTEDTYALLVRAIYIVIVLVYVVGFVLFEWILFQMPQTKVRNVLWSVESIGAGSQIFSAAVVIYCAYGRLSQVPLLIEVSYYRAAVERCFQFASIFILIGLISFVFLMAQSSGDEQNSFIICIEVLLNIGTSSVLSISLMFVFVDTNTSLSILRDLISLARMQRLTLQHLRAARDEINRRNAEASFSNHVMAITAILNGIGFVVLCFVNFKYFPSQSVENYLGTVMMSVVLLLKEVFYLLIMFIQAAFVNEKANLLQQVLGSDEWTDNTTSTSRAAATEPPTLRYCGGVTDIDSIRMKLYINVDVDPISFRVLGIRMTRNTVYLQLAGYIAAVFIGILNSILTSNVNV